MGLERENVGDDIVVVAVIMTLDERIGRHSMYVVSGSWSYLTVKDKQD